ncbi:hypothetical protein R3P38DRAFT_3524410 [Favolaschia claudopus]|uniref:Uncharacterized protein n=1 Tax=Favolaschia claudopus TaxID=2862362 RepID=A0AAW0BKV2_9AGAR
MATTTMLRQWVTANVFCLVGTSPLKLLAWMVSYSQCTEVLRDLIDKFYCSIYRHDRCGFDNVKQRLHTFAASGGNTDMFWDNVKHAQKPEAVVLSHDPLGSVTLRAQSANKLEPLRAALAEVQRHRSAIARNDALFLRKCLLKLAIDRASQISQCGFDGRLCWDDEFVADRGSAIIEGSDAECTEQWWCTESPQCVRHQG